MVGKLRIFLVALLCLPLCGAWPNTGRMYPSNISYTGPGDVVAAKAWWGLRAYNNTLANAGPTVTKVVDVLGSNTATTCTIFLRGDGTGNLDLATSGAGGMGNQCASGATTFCTVTNTSCSVSQWYDQSGASSCAGACFMSQGVAANQPVLKFSGCSSGSLPCLSCTVASQSNLIGTGLTQAQALTTSGVAKATGTTSAMRYATVTISSQLESVLAGTSNNTAVTYAGSANVSATAAGGTWWSVLTVVNGASTSITVDGSTTSPGNPGTNGYAGSNFGICVDAFVNYSDGFMSEVGLWAGTLTAPQISTMNSNMQAYWGI